MKEQASFEDTKPELSKVQLANIELHTKLSHVYNTDEPHWRPENVKRVTDIVRALKDKVKAESMADLGCGTGFMINIGRELGVKNIYGVDITPAMLSQVKTGGDSKVTLYRARSDETPIQNESVELVTAYTFLSHLERPEDTYAEAYRILKKGGCFYSDLDPNAAMWGALDAIPRQGDYHEFVQREITHSLNTDKVLEEKYGVPTEVYQTAEFQKTKKKGLDEAELRTQMRAIGFSKVEIRYNWFVGQGLINNDPSLSPEQRRERMHTIDTYLQNALPLSACLYKYISFIAWK